MISSVSLVKPFKSVSSCNGPSTFTYMRGPLAKIEGTVTALNRERARSLEVGKTRKIKCFLGSWSSNVTACTNNATHFRSASVRIAPVHLNIQAR
jgi:hypothetical protein